MEDTELFGELHEQEENGLYGRKHAELCFLQNVSKSCFFKDKDKPCYVVTDLKCEECPHYK